jgi:hypothetical protein
VPHKSPWAFALWYRPYRGAPWEPVATAPTHAAAFALIGCGDRRGGDWYVCEVGRVP